MKHLLFPLFMCFGIITHAQTDYNVNLIKPELKAHASVVIRMQDMTFDVKSPAQASYSIKTAITILNEQGQDESVLSAYYNNFSSISNLKATMYNEKGEKVKEYKSADFKDRSAISDGSIYEDGRMKYLEFLNSSYPYTIEYSFTKDFTGLISYPSWNPVADFRYAVESATYTFKIPSEMKFRFLNSAGLKTETVNVKDKTEYRWICKDFAALEYEPLSTGLKNVSPWVSLAPNAFEYDRAPGNLETWENVGAWVFKLNSEPQLLPPATRAKVAELIKDVTDPREKIRRLYQYLQSNTRYVSVQLGIGGFKPISADKVAAVNYGDCKALSNYMKALLQEAGIAAHLVVIGAGMPSMNEKFSSMNQANHMILHVPLKNDAVWLECTSQQLPMGYLTYDCSDKNVLLVTEAGGRMVRTPKYTPEDNFQDRKINISINESGAAQIDIDTDYGYAQFENVFPLLFAEPADQRKYVMRSFSIPNMKLISAEYIQTDKTKPRVKEKVTLQSSQVTTSGADKILLTLNMLNRRSSVPQKATSRQTNFSVEFAYHDKDEIIYDLPVNMKVEFLPKDVSITSEFGSYEMKVVQQANKIIYTRTQVMHKKEYPALKYNELVEFYKKVFQADKLKGILAKAI